MRGQEHRLGIKQTVKRMEWQSLKARILELNYPGSALPTTVPCDLRISLNLFMPWFPFHISGRLIVESVKNKKHTMCLEQGLNTLKP